MISKLIHWGMALIFLALILMGFYFDKLSYSSLQFTLLSYHKSFGLLILWLVGLRILWRSFNQKPQAITTHKTWEKRLSKAVHILLYIGLIGMPLSGWIMSMSGGYPVGFFGLNVPSFLDKNEELNKLSYLIHRYLAFTMVFAFFLHSIGAFKHHFIDKDETLTRMSLTKSPAATIVTGLIFIGFWGFLIWILFG